MIASLYLTLRRPTCQVPRGFQLSRISVNCYFKTMKKYPIDLKLTDF